MKRAALSILKFLGYLAGWLAIIWMLGAHRAATEVLEYAQF